MFNLLEPQLGRGSCSDEQLLVARAQPNLGHHIGFWPIEVQLNHGTRSDMPPESLRTRSRPVPQLGEVLPILQLRQVTNELVRRRKSEILQPFT